MQSWACLSQVSPIEFSGTYSKVNMHRGQPKAIVICPACILDSCVSTSATARMTTGAFTMSVSSSQAGLKPGKVC